MRPEAMRLQRLVLPPTASRAVFRVAHLARSLSTSHHHPRSHGHHEGTSAAVPEASVQFDRDGHLGTVVLNRPKALNALNLEMVRALNAQFRGAWNSREKGVAAVWLSGAGGRAFCAGGDIKTLWEGRGSPAGLAEQAAFFSEEYAVDHLLAKDSALHRPHVAVYDGTVMGGGVGISIHAAFRVATERTVFAMPETGIGFFPDVGGSFFLPRIPLGPAFGLFLALTGHRITGADAVHAGLATHFVPSAGLAALREDAAEALRKRTPRTRDDAVAALSLVLDRHAVPLPAFTITPSQLRAIGGACGRASVAEVAEALHASAREAADVSDAAFLGKAAKTLDRASPTSLRVTFEQLRRGAALPSLAACLAMELRVALRFMHGRSADFYEGVRAVIVDKDGKPAWEPSTVDGVSDAAVEAFFAPLQPPTHELRLE